MITIALAALLALQDDTKSNWGWVDFVDEGFSGMRARASLGTWDGLDPGERIHFNTVYNGSTTLFRLEPDEISATFFAFAIGVSIERFEFEIEYFTGSGDGDGTGEGTVPGTVDFDVEVSGARISVSRPIWGLDGENFDLLFGATLAAMFLQTEIDDVAFSPYDPANPSAGLDGSDELEDIFFGAFGWVSAALRLGDDAGAFLRGEIGHYLGDAGGLEARLSLGITFRF